MSRSIHKMRGAKAIEIVGQITGNVSSTDATEHNLGNIDVGAATADKNVIMLTTSLDGAFGRRVTSVTVGGVSLVEKVGVVSGGSEPVSASIWAADISSISGSQTVLVGFPNGTQSVGCSGVAISGLRSLTPTMTDTDTTGSSGLLTGVNLAAPFAGIAFGVGVSEGLGAAVTWGSITKVADIGTGGSGIDDHRHTAGWDLGFRAAADETLSFSSGTDRSLAVAGFR